MRKLFVLALVLLGVAAPATGSSHYLFTWATELQDSPKRSGQDFIAVFDVAPDSPDFGKLVATLPVGKTGGHAHHANNDLPANGRLFAEDFIAGQWFVFDLHDALHPALIGHYANVGAYTHPHSFEQLPSGDTLATFQYTGDNKGAGGLVELDPRGHVVRTSASAADPKVDTFIRPYSMEIVPKLDRVVVSSTDMMSMADSHSFQVWRLSDLKLIKTVRLPAPVAFKDAVPLNSSEPRLLSDGVTVLIPTFSCGLYKIDGLAGTNPTARFVYDFGERSCAVATVIGNYWVESTLSGHSVTSLDVSDPLHPKEVGRIVFQDTQALPHWIAKEPGGNRIVITGYGSLRNHAYFASIDPATGALTLLPQSIDFTRQWPDGWNGPAVPHTALFSNGNT